MHGVLLLAVCVFTLLCALAVAARRPVAAIIALAAGAGWPATILPGSDDLARGAVLCAAALALVAWLRPDGRRAPPQILAGTALVDRRPDRLELGIGRQGPVPGAGRTGTSPPRPASRVSVEYVWNANYDGIQLAEEANARLHGARAPPVRVLARDDARRLRARPLGRRPDRSLLGRAPEPGRPLAGRSAPPRGGARPVALEARGRDESTPFATGTSSGPSQPVQYDSRSIGNVQYLQNGVGRSPSRPCSRGDEYTVWGYTPQPKPRAARAVAGRLSAGDLRRWPLPAARAAASPAPPFGSPERRSWADSYFGADGPGRALRAALRRGAADRRQGDEPVRGDGRARGLVPLARRLHLRRAAAARARSAAARPVRDQDEARLLPALRRGDGAHAPLPGHPRPRRRRLHERPLRREAGGPGR